MFDLASPLRTWALATDPRVWLMILALGAVTLGRAGLLRSEWLNLLKPWRARKHGPNPAGPARPTAARHPLRDPWFLFFLVISATAVTAWIVTTMIVTTRNR